jgi:hypothetical protein
MTGGDLGSARWDARFELRCNNANLNEAERKLPRDLMAIHEILNVRWDVAQLKIAASAQLIGDVFGDVFGPASCGVERNHTDRVLILTGQQVRDHGFQVGCLKIGLPARIGNSTLQEPAN